MALYEEVSIISDEERAEETITLASEEEESTDILVKEEVDEVTITLEEESGESEITLLPEDDEATDIFVESEESVVNMNYRYALNKPSINEVTLIDNKQLEDLFIFPLTNSEIEAIIDWDSW